MDGLFAIIYCLNEMEDWRVGTEETTIESTRKLLLKCKRPIIDVQLISF